MGTAIDLAELLKVIILIPQTRQSQTYEVPESLKYIS